MTVETIGNIKQTLKETDILNMTGFIDRYKEDQRTGVIKLIESAQKKIDNYNKELKRLEVMAHYEREYGDYRRIAGIDEVGRGPLAGPVVTAAVILPVGCQLLHVNDSKKVSQKMREALYDEIMEKAIAVSIGIEGVDVIDDINILQATYSAMRKAVNDLEVQPDLLLVDAVKIPGLSMPQVSIIKGDEKSISIAAASIIAKVTRDRMMVDYDALFPEYGFASNKGYGAQVHIDAIKSIGPCPIHRRTFIKNFV